MILGHGPLLYNWIQLICSWSLLVSCWFKGKALGNVARWAEFIFCAMSVWRQGFEWFQLSSLENQNLSWISRLKASQWNKFVVVVASVKICWKTILSNSQFFIRAYFSRYSSSRHQLIRKGLAWPGTASAQSLSFVSLSLSRSHALSLTHTDRHTHTHTHALVNVEPDSTNALFIFQQGSFLLTSFLSEK